MKLQKGQKKGLFAYALHINRTDNVKGWEKVEPSFSSKYAAMDYRERRYPDAKAWTIKGIKFNVLPLTGKEV